jgi:hypothetical protein
MRDDYIERGELMNNKKAKIFLCIGLICFLLTTIGVIIYNKLEYDRIQEAYTNDWYEIKIQNAMRLLMLCWVIIPGLLVELSGIRSTYKLLKHKPKGNVKICYLISASLAFLAIAVVLLCYIGGLIIKVSNFFLSIMIITMWPSFIISFILGSIPVKHKKGMKS